MCTKGKLVGIYFGLICILRGWQNSGYQGQPFSPTPLPPLPNRALRIPNVGQEDARQETTLSACQAE